MIYIIAGCIAVFAFMLWRGEFYLVGPAYLKLGRVSRRDNPIAYWAFIFFFAFFGTVGLAWLLLQPHIKS